MATIIITTATATTTITTTSEMLAVYHDHIEVIPTANAAKTDVAPAQTANAAKTDVAPAQTADEAKADVVPAQTADEAKADVVPAQTADEAKADVVPTQTADTTEQQVEAHDTTKQTADVTAKDGVPAVARLCIDPQLQAKDTIEALKDLLINIIKLNTCTRKMIFGENFWVFKALDSIKDSNVIKIKFTDNQGNETVDECWSSKFTSDATKLVTELEKLVKRAIDIGVEYEDSVSNGFCFRPNNVASIYKEFRWDLIWE